MQTAKCVSFNDKIKNFCCFCIKLSTLFFGPLLIFKLCLNISKATGPYQKIELVVSNPRSYFFTIVFQIFTRLGKRGI